MNVLDFFSSGIDKVVDSVGNTLDQLITSDEEREKLKNELEQIRVNAKLQATEKSIELEKEITKRWELDNSGTLTRLVRPLVLAWVYFVFTIAVLFDGNIGAFTINNAYLPLLETILVTVTIAYFGSRGIEKTTKILKDNNLDLF